jgi:hypothetical protein
MTHLIAILFLIKETHQKRKLLKSCSLEIKFIAAFGNF